MKESMVQGESISDPKPVVPELRGVVESEEWHPENVNDKRNGPP